MAKCGTCGINDVRDGTRYLCPDCCRNDGFGHCVATSQDPHGLCRLCLLPESQWNLDYVLIGTLMAELYKEEQRGKVRKVEPEDRTKRQLV